jgi:outer membrane protein
MSRKSVMDSLLLDVQKKKSLMESNPNSVNKSDFEKSRTNYMGLEENFGNDALKIKNEYQEQIWKQLNQYIREYGEQNGYSFIHGAMGNGNLMYAAESKDLTKDILAFCNKRYAGK